MRCWLAAVVMALALASAGPAWAGEIQLSPFIKGAGSIEVPDPFYFCGTGQQLGELVVTCPPQTFGTPDATTSISLVATPSDEPAGHWSFDHWEGDCPTPSSPDVCELTAPDATTVSASPTAVFVDSVAPTLLSVVISRPTFSTKAMVQFSFTADEEVHYECQMDDGEVSGCPSGIFYFEEDLGPGAHQLTVWPIDGSDNKGDPVTTAFTVAAPPKPPATKPPAVIPPITLLFPRVLGPSRVAVKVSRKRVVSLGRVRMRCPAGVGRCPGSVVLEGKIAKKGKRIVVARKRYSLRPSTTARVKLRLTRKAARALEARRRLKVTASIAVRAPNVTTRKDVAVTLRAAKPPRVRKR